MTLHAVSSEDADRLDKLARYIAYGVEQKAAGAAVGYSAGRVSQLMQDESFQELVQKHQQEILSTYVDTNRMYDEIERRALTNLLDHARLSKDPDLNLKLAMLANRATRRGGGTLAAGNKMLDATQPGIVHIDLSFNLVQRVQEKELTPPKVIDGESRDVSIASPGMVERILAGIPSEELGTGYVPIKPKTEENVGLSRFFAPIDS